MAEESEGQDTGAEAAASGVDPFAAAMALGGASREEADNFLRNQNALIADQRKLVQLQAKELAHELKLRHWSLQLRHASAILKFALEASIALIAIALACFIGAVVWNAAHSDGLIVDSFSVPPEMVQHGLTGQVVASQILDRLAEFQSETVSARAPRSFANDWGDDIKVEIPETGISLGEAYSYLKEWLSHETHVTGEVISTESGIALAARVSGGGSATYVGTEADLNDLVQQTAESIYAQTQPYRYGVYLISKERTSQALAIFQNLATAGSAQDRPWGYIGWSNGIIDTDFDAHMKLLQRALALQPDNALVLQNLAVGESFLDHPERALRYDKELLLALGRSGQRLINAAEEPYLLDLSNARTTSITGDFQKAAQDQEGAITIGFYNFIVSLSSDLARYQIGLHEPATARMTAAHPVRSNSADPGTAALFNIGTQMLIDSEFQDWASVSSEAAKIGPVLSEYPDVRSQLPIETAPVLAYAQAKLGDFSAAGVNIAATPADCYDCLISRARIADIEGQHARADWWFDRAVKSNPSIPMAYADWAQSFLMRGDPDGAIAKFTIANQKSPHFADPLEGWGEALMVKNRSDLALAKFEEADKYAPNWGRLHLKWGEALAYAGKKDEAQKQFALAAGLDLSADDKADLAKVSHG